MNPRECLGKIAESVKIIYQSWRASLPPPIMTRSTARTYRCQLCSKLDFKPRNLQAR